MRVRLGLLAVCLALTSAAPAGAAEGNEDDLLREGVALREAGRDEEALTLFARAYAVRAAPRARAQMALAEQALGRWVAARAHLQEALASQDPWVEKNRAALEGALRAVESHVGFLDVRGDAPGAEVRVDGERVGTLPMAAPVALEVGDHALEVTAPGRYPAARRVRVEGGAVSRESVRLAPRGEASAAGAAATQTAPPTEVSSPPSPLRVLGWVGIGLGGALVAGGAVALGAREGQVRAYNEDAACPGLDEPTQPAGCADRVSSANTLAALGAVGLVGGAVLASAGALGLWLAPAPATAGGLRSTRVGFAPGQACITGQF